MSLAEDVQSLAPGLRVALFELDLTPVAPTEGVFRFHAGVNEKLEPVVWQGHEYAPMPIEAEGFEVASDGRLPRPRLRVANLRGVFSPYLKSYDDLIGCKVTRRRTLARYLDAVNFASGINPFADPTAEWSLDVFYINQKTAETTGSQGVLEFELASVMEMEGIKLPRRQVLGNVCWWAVMGRYRGEECGYEGAAYFDANDKPTDLAGDKCGGRCSSCVLRFGVDAVLPFGGFPGAALIPGST
jgi:lambda family phage minor tail protein L